MFAIARRQLCNENNHKVEIIRVVDIEAEAEDIVVELNMYTNKDFYMYFYISDYTAKELGF